mmetsp:Transcript_9116/g.22636  ORF Transcript_9116/g.22636 Transcript_9116/m.22636 type:complete len:304 (-) Transcript_9116:1058-1969(-)
MSYNFSRALLFLSNSTGAAGAGGGGSGMAAATGATGCTVGGACTAGGGVATAAGAAAAPPERTTLHVSTADINAMRSVTNTLSFKAGGLFLYIVTAPSMHATMPSMLASALAATGGAGCPAKATLQVSTAACKAARRVTRTLSRMVGGLLLYMVMAPSMQAIVLSMLAGSALALGAGAASGVETTGAAGTGVASTTAGVALTASALGSAFCASSFNIFVSSSTKPSKRSTSGPFKRPLPNPGPPRCFNINPIKVRRFCCLTSSLEVTLTGLGSSTTGAGASSGVGSGGVVLACGTTTSCSGSS